jgi:hypothetical protein
LFVKLKLEIMLVYLAIIVIVCSYAYLSLRPRTDFQIIQSNLSKLTDSTLHEKYPILINDQVVNAEDLCDSLFKYQYFFKKTHKLEINKTRKNFSKYLILHNTNKCDVNIKLCNNIHVDIIIPPYNVLVVPYSWSVSDSDNELNCIQLNDFVHFFFNIHLN